MGLLAANLLGGRGLRVLGIDRAAGPSGEPRAAVTDGEALRSIQAAGLAGEVLARATVLERVELADARGRVHVVQDGLPRPDGHPALVSLSQADLEAVLLRGARRFGSVELRWGCPWEELAAPPARFVLGCDGARSSVRRTLGIPLRGFSADERWLVADVAVRAPLDLPGTVRFLGDPRRPGVMLPLGPDLRRWEWRLGAEEAPDPARLLAPWLALADHELVRAAVYVYHARLAARWRAGSTFLLGDAAHLLPPFGGQGLSLGLRDAHALAWRLAEGSDLERWETERRRAARAALALALGWGAVVGARRPRLATARDVAIATLERSPLASALRAGAGLRPRSPLLPQPRVRLGDGRELLLDDALGPGWATLRVGESSLEVRGERWALLDDLLDAWRGRTVVLRPDHATDRA